MRIAGSLLALPLMLLLSAPADAQSKRHKRYDNDSRSAYTTSDGRSTTVDREGRCVRDSGRPLDSLNLNHKCDREEFWERIRERDRSWR